MIFDLYDHTVLQKWATIAKNICGQCNLLIGFRIHERQHIVDFKKELLVLLVQSNAFNFISRSEALVQLAPIAQILHFDLCECATLTRFYVIHFYGAPKATLVFQHIAGTNFISVDFWHGSLRVINKAKG